MRTVSNLLFQEVGQMCDVLKFWSLLNSVMLCGRVHGSRADVVPAVTAQQVEGRFGSQAEFERQVGRPQPRVVDQVVLHCHLLGRKRHRAKQCEADQNNSFHRMMV